MTGRIGGTGVGPVNGMGVRRGMAEPVQRGRSVATGTGVKIARMGSRRSDRLNGVGAATGIALPIRTSTTRRRAS